MKSLEKIFGKIFAFFMTLIIFIFSFGLIFAALLTALIKSDIIQLAAHRFM